MDWLTFWTLAVQLAIVACLLMMIGVVGAAAVQAVRERTPDQTDRPRSGGPR